MLYPQSPVRLRSVSLLFAMALALPPVGALAQQGDPGDELETVIVTASRTPASAMALPAAWSSLDNETLERISPQHSNQVFNRIAGSWVSRGNGQESLISLRSPVLTGAGSCGALEIL